jgi:hypothetical protein
LKVLREIKRILNSKEGEVELLAGDLHRIENLMVNFE